MRLQANANSAAKMLARMPPYLVAPRDTLTLMRRLARDMLRGGGLLRHSAVARHVDADAALARDVLRGGGLLRHSAVARHVDADATLARDVLRGGVVLLLLMQAASPLTETYALIWASFWS